MGELKIDGVVASNLTNVMTDFSVDPATSADEPNGLNEQFYDNNDYLQYEGYYNEIPELASAIDAKATWTVGKGFKADEETTILLDTIQGNGSDTFNTILENMIRQYNIGGDAFAEIRRDDEGNLINLVPFSPHNVRIVINQRGMIERFEIKNRVDKKTHKIKKEDMFYLPRNRVGEKFHGTSIIKRLVNIILMRNEAMTDWKRVLHRNVDPMMIYHLETEDATEIAAFKTKTDAAKGKGENMYIPKGAVVPEQISLAPNSALNPLAWIESLNKYFFQATGVPQIIVGGSAEFTEATAKIAYLAFQQTIEEEQLFVEEQVLRQLNLIIELEFPASLENELLSDTKKDGNDLTAVQPNDTVAELEGRK